MGGADNGGTNSTTLFVAGHYVYAGIAANSGTCSGSTNTGCEVQTYDITGFEATSLIAHSLEAGTLQVRSNAFFDNQVSIRGGLNVIQVAFSLMVVLAYLRHQRPQPSMAIFRSRPRPSVVL